MARFTPSWTAKAARARSLRKIKALLGALEKCANEVAYEWDDVDQSIVWLCDDLKADTKLQLGEIIEAMDFNVANAE